MAGTSIRDITAAAETNLGAINYHFGSKHELVVEVFRRRLKPVSERRAVLLQAAKEAAGDQPPTVEALLDALIRPVAEQSYAHEKRDTAFMRLSRSRTFRWTSRCGECDSRWARCITRC